MRILSLENHNMCSNYFNSGYNKDMYNSKLVSKNDLTKFSPMFRGNKYKLLKEYGEAAFCIFKNTKEVKEPVKRMNTVQTITAGSAILASCVSGAFAQIGRIEYPILRTITYQMCFRIGGCYGLNPKYIQIGEFISISAGWLVGSNLAKEVLKSYPGLGNVTNSVITAVLHEITGNIWIKLLEDWYKKKPVKSEGTILKIDAKTLEKIRESLLKEKTIEQRINDYNVPEIIKLIETLKDDIAFQIMDYNTKFAMLKLRRVLGKINQKEYQKSLEQIQSKFIISINESLLLSVKRVAIENQLKSNIVKNNQLRVPFNVENSVCIKNKVKQESYFTKIINTINNLYLDLPNIWMKQDNKIS